MSEPAIVRGDSRSAITGVNKFGETRDPRVEFLMRLLGVIEMSAGWCFEAVNMLTSGNVMANGISRWPRS